MCSKEIGVCAQHKWRDLYDHLMRNNNIHFDIEKTFIYAPKIMRKMVTYTIWVATKCVFHILQEVGCSVKSFCLRPTYLIVFQG